MLREGVKKVLGICRLPRRRHFRRLDLLAVPPDELPFALLYFTGSQAYNIRVRNVAKERGYSLSERGLRPLTEEAEAALRAALAERPMETEADVLAFLGLPYVRPEERVA